MLLLIEVRAQGNEGDDIKIEIYLDEEYSSLRTFDTHTHT
jgi:hypothetical protein